MGDHDHPLTSLYPHIDHSLTSLYPEFDHTLISKERRLLEFALCLSCLYCVTLTHVTYPHFILTLFVLRLSSVYPQIINQILNLCYTCTLMISTLYPHIILSLSSDYPQIILRISPEYPLIVRTLIFKEHLLSA